MSRKAFRKGSHQAHETYKGQHRFEHWYVDNQVYFITVRVRDQIPALQTDAAKTIFWNQFDHYVGKTSYVPWVTSLLDNHYHTLGYLRIGLDLPLLMRGLHGSVAKRVNDLLETRIVPFWVGAGHQNYFDGCIRNEQQARRAFRYTLTQCRRHGICPQWEHYPHTRVNVDVERAVRRSHELKAFMESVPYKRYQSQGISRQ
ncbi:MAG TPA: hypothetical protein VGB55_14425 [Tepidisphaeraceae bacterium]|jgi:hypothetical protein